MEADVKQQLCELLFVHFILILLDKFPAS